MADVVEKPFSAADVEQLEFTGTPEIASYTRAEEKKYDTPNI